MFVFFRCTCGNCVITSLQNISECYCCSELEGCQDSMKSDLVLEDIGADVTLKCVTEHPGFRPVCLQKWSLRLAAGRYKTKGKQTYRQTGSEGRLVRHGCIKMFSNTFYMHAWNIFLTVILPIYKKSCENDQL